MSFQRDLYQIVRGAIPKPALRLCHTEFKLIRELMFTLSDIDPKNNQNKFNDSQIEHSFSYYSAACFESLMVELLPTMENIVWKKLYPTYSYARFYYNDAEMVVHTDRPSCEYSATVCIDNDQEYGPWEIWFELTNGKQIDIHLQPGDLIVYKGDILKHWRTPYQGNEQCQAFLHYVDQNGPYAEYKYDTRPGLLAPPEYRKR